MPPGGIRLARKQHELLAPEAGWCVSTLPFNERVDIGIQKVPPWIRALHLFSCMAHKLVDDRFVLHFFDQCAYNFAFAYPYMNWTEQRLGETSLYMLLNECIGSLHVLANFSLSGQVLLVVVALSLDCCVLLYWPVLICQDITLAV